MRSRAIPAHLHPARFANGTGSLSWLAPFRTQGCAADRTELEDSTETVARGLICHHGGARADIPARASPDPRLGPPEGQLRPAAS